MCELSNTSGSDSDGSTSWTDGDSSDSFTGKDYYQKIIGKANSVSILKICKIYNIKVPPGVTKITCPLKSHKGGHEKTPSLQLFLETNSFYCHGCTAGSKGTDLVSKMDGISKVNASHKILSMFQANFDDSTYLDSQDTGEKLELIIKFSDAVRNFRQSHFDEKSEAFIEKICSVYDRLSDKHQRKLDNESFKSIIGKFIYVINSYKPCYKL